MTYTQSRKYTVILALAFFGIALLLSLYKYTHFLYNAMDLAIFNQALHNTVHGDFLRISIHHANSYFADHFSLLFVSLTPLYYIFPSPITLLIIQAVLVTLAVWPLYLIAKKHLSPAATLFICALYLFNPITISFLLFEFHLLPSILFFGFWAFYFYDQKRIAPFFMFLLLILFIREDAPFVVFGFGLLALFQKRNWKWILPPCVISVAYFFGATAIIREFNNGDAYKFVVYFS